MQKEALCRTGAVGIDNPGQSAQHRIVKTAEAAVSDKADNSANNQAGTPAEWMLVESHTFEVALLHSWPLRARVARPGPLLPEPWKCIPMPLKLETLGQLDGC